MTIERIVIEVAGVLILFGVPFATLVWPGLPRRPRALLGRIFLTVLVVWLLLVLHRSASLPTLLREAQARGNIHYDGVGGNVAVLLFGWMPAFFGCLPSIVIVGIRNLIHRRREAAQTSETKIAEQAAGGDP